MGASKWPDGMTNSDWYAIAGSMQEFEELNQVTLILSIASSGTPASPDLIGLCNAYTTKDVAAGAVPLASASARCSALRCRTLMGLFTYLLYQIDFQLADHELSSVNKNRA